MGHTGTLDPFATGLLVVLLGGATRLARFLEGDAKRYRATIRLGQATATDDLTGAVTASAADGWSPSDDEIRAALESFVGTAPQRPPPYSAKKVAGIRSYDLARQGRAPELAPVEVTIHRIDLVARTGMDVVIRTEVSAGTYIRALARDLGERLGGAAHLVELRREGIGSFEVNRAVTLDALSPDSPMLTPVELLAAMPVQQLSEADARAVGHGRSVTSEVAGGPRVALVREGRLIAVAESDEALLRPVVVLEAAP